MSIGVQPKVAAVSVQDNTNPVIFSHAVTSLATNLSLASDAAIGATSVVLNAGHATSSFIYLKPDTYYALKVVNIGATTSNINILATFGVDV